MRKLLSAVLAGAFLFTFATVSFAEPDLSGDTYPPEDTELSVDTDTDDEIAAEPANLPAEESEEGDNTTDTEVVQEPTPQEAPAIEEDPVQPPVELELSEAPDADQVSEDTAEEPVPEPVESELAEEIEAALLYSIDAAQLLSAEPLSNALEENGFQYEIVDGNATITRYVGKDTDVVIPSVIGGAKVTQIGTMAFQETSISSVTIPHGVSNIGDMAFDHCTSLKSVTLPDGLVNIGSNAFHYCITLGDVLVPDSVRTLGRGVFQGCESISSIVIPEGVTEIPELAFQACFKLKNVVLPRTTSKIAKRAFMECTSLNCITIPDVTEIDSLAFKLKHINSDPVPIKKVRFLGKKDTWNNSQVKKDFPSDLTYVVCDDWVMNPKNLDLQFSITADPAPVYRGQPVVVKVEASGKDAELLKGTDLTSRVVLSNTNKPEIYPNLKDGKGGANVKVGNAAEITGMVARISAQDVNTRCSSPIVVSEARASVVAEPADDIPDPVPNPETVVVGQKYKITVSAAPDAMSGTLELQGMRILSPEDAEDVNSIDFSSSAGFSCIVETTGSEPVGATIKNAKAYEHPVRNTTSWEPKLDGTNLRISRSGKGPIYPGQQITLTITGEGYNAGALADQTVKCKAQFEGLTPYPNELEEDVFKLINEKAELHFTVEDAKTARLEVETIDKLDLEKFTPPVWSSKISTPSASISVAPAGALEAPDDINTTEVRLGEEYTLRVNGDPDVAQGTLLLSGIEVIAPATCAGKSEVPFSEDARELTVRIAGQPTASLANVTAYGSTVTGTGEPWTPRLVAPDLEIAPMEPGPYYAGQQITLLVKASEKHGQLLNDTEFDLTADLAGLRQDDEVITLKDGKATVHCTVERNVWELSAEISRIEDLEIPNPAVWSDVVSTPSLKIKVARRGEEPGNTNPFEVKSREEYVLTIEGSPNSVSGTLVLRGAVVVDSAGNEVTGPIAFNSLDRASYMLWTTGSTGVSAVLKDVTAYGEPVDASNVRWKPVLLDRHYTIWPDEFGPYYPGQPVTLIVEEHGYSAHDAETLAGKTIPFEVEFTGLEPQTDSFELKDREALIPCIIQKDASFVSAALTKVGEHVPKEDMAVWESGLSVPSAAIRVSKKGEPAQVSNPSTVEIGQEYELSVEGSPDVLEGKLVLKGLQVTEPAGLDNMSSIPFRCPDTATFTVKVIGPKTISASIQDVTAYGCDVRTDSSWQPTLRIAPPSGRPTNAPPVHPSYAPGPGAQSPPAYYPPEPAATTPPELEETPTPNTYGPRPIPNPDHEHAEDWPVHGGEGDSILEVRPLGTPEEFISCHDVVTRFLDEPDANVEVLHLDGTAREHHLPVATGHRIRFNWPDDTTHSVHIVVKGDVHGTGMHGLYQIVRMAQAYTHAVPLSNLQARAADMNSNGRLELTDIITATHDYIASRS